METLTGTVRPAAPLKHHEEGKVRPVVWWAGLGVIFLIIEAIAFSGWFSSGDAQSTPTGPAPVPTYTKVIIHTWEIAGPFIGLIVLYHFLVKPWRREGRITQDGLMCLVFMTLIWQDVLMNYFQVYFTYSAEWINLGSWYTHVPGWLSPQANLVAEPIVWLVPMYVYLLFGMTVVGCAVMRKAKARWPHLGKFGLSMVCFAFFVVVDVVFETPFMRLGLWAYPGAIKELTFFHGHYYQYPAYDPIIGGLWWASFSWIRYFRNDKGQTVAERGIERLKVSGAKTTGIRFLAFVGVFNAAFLIYNIPMALVGLYADPWPQDILKRTHLVNGICGEGTTYACSGPEIPIPTPRSARIGPDGNLLGPDGTPVLPTPKN